MQLTKLHPPLLQPLRGIILAPLLLVKVFLGIDPPADSALANFLLELHWQRGMNHLSIHIMPWRSENFEFLHYLGILFLGGCSLPHLASTLALLLLRALRRMGDKSIFYLLPPGNLLARGIWVSGFWGMLGIGGFCD